MSEPAAPLYEAIVRITRTYLGPAADRFIARQVQSHLHKEPEDLTPEDLSLLIDWIRVAVSLLTDDKEIVEEYITQLVKVGQPTKPKRQVKE